VSRELVGHTGNDHDSQDQQSLAKEVVTFAVCRSQMNKVECRDLQDAKSQSRHGLSGRVAYDGGAEESEVSIEKEPPGPRSTQAFPDNFHFGREGE
jgi:hypothetical protein